MALGVMGLLLWVGTRIAQGAGKAVTGAQSVYIKMIEDLQKKADADRERQEARLAELDEKIARDKTYIAQLEADLEAARARSLQYARLLAEAQTGKAVPTAQDGAPNAAAEPGPA